MSYRSCLTFKIEVLLLITVITASIPGLAMAACVCGGGDGLLTLNQTMVMDGSMSDWDPIFADVDNNVCDSTSGQPGERDGTVQHPGRDAVHFAFTYDSNYVYLFTERNAGNSTQTFLYYADVNNNGFMEQNEPVIGVEWKGNSGEVDVYVLQYDPIDAINGDSTVDSQGFGDGYALPGKIVKATIPKNPNYTGTWGSADGLRMEFRIPWGDFGVPAGTGHSIHVSSTNTNFGAASLGSQIDDNLGGCGGGSGSIQFADLDFTGSYTLEGYRLNTVSGLHHLVNLGNGDDAFSFAYSISGPHAPSITYWLDDGSLTFNSALDTAIGTTVGVAVGSSVDIFVVYDIIGSATAGTATIISTAISEFNPSQTDSVTDTVRALVPSLVTVKYVSRVVDVNPATPPGFDKALPGSVVTYTVSVTNSGNGPPDNDSVFLSDTLSSLTPIYIGTGATSPVNFNTGTTLLTYNYSSLASTTDDIGFTSESSGSPAYTYTPVPVGGYDSAVTGFRVNPKGTFDSSTSFSLTYDVTVP